MYDIQKAADETKRNLDLLKNKAVVLKNAIENIRISLKVRPDIPSEKLFNIYEEAKAALPDAVVKEIREVSDFHNRLITNRVKRSLSSLIKTVLYCSQLWQTKHSFEIRGTTWKRVSHFCHFQVI